MSTDSVHNTELNEAGCLGCGRKYIPICGDVGVFQTPSKTNAVGYHNDTCSIDRLEEVC